MRDVYIVQRKIDYILSGVITEEELWEAPLPPFDPKNKRVLPPYVFANVLKKFSVQKFPFFL
jgi:hypothetical protein